MLANGAGTCTVRLALKYSRTAYWFFASLTSPVAMLLYQVLVLVLGSGFWVLGSGFWYWYWYWYRYLYSLLLVEYVIHCAYAYQQYQGVPELPG